MPQSFSHYNAARSIAFSMLIFCALWPMPIQAQIKMELLNEHGTLVFSDKINALTELNNWKEKAKQDSWKDGYLAFEIDSIEFKDSSLYHVHAYLGPKLEWGVMQIDSTVVAVYRSRFNQQSGPLLANGIEQFHQKILEIFAQSGYPFAETYFNNINIDKGLFNATINADKGPLILFDSLIVNSARPLPQKYLSQYLEIKKGQLYDERILQKIPQRIKEIPFVQQNGPVEILFDGNKAKIYVNLEDRKASFVNGVAGLQPDTDNEGYIITGQLDLKLLNGLRLGETFVLNWKRIQVETQDLAIEAQYPFIFGLPLGIEGKVKIFRRDSTFNSVALRASLVYLVQGGHKIKLFNESTQNTSLSSINFNPSLGNSKSNSYGIGAEFRNTDHFFNPIKGYTIFIEGSAGRRTLRDTLLSSDGLVLPGKTEQYSLSTHLQLFIPLSQRMTILVQERAALIRNGKTMLNEMYRIGGLNTLRGSDEESIYATTYSISTFEWRLLLGEFSRLFVFYDQAWYERKSLELAFSDSPSGLGAGISFETKGGIFSLSYALGRSGSQSFELRTSRVHFGFTSLF